MASKQSTGLKKTPPETHSSMTGEGWIFLFLLLGAPLFALGRLSATAEVVYLGLYWVMISGITYLIYARDKRRSVEKGWRDPEKLLHLLELIGGWPGAFVAQRRLRHKCTKPTYQVVFWLIVALYQFVAIDYLRSWAFTRQTKQKLEHVMSGK